MEKIYSQFSVPYDDIASTINTLQAANVGLTIECWFQDLVVVGNAIVVYSYTSLVRS